MNPRHQELKLVYEQKKGSTKYLMLLKIKYLVSVFYQAHQSVEKIIVHHRIRTAEVSHLLFKIVLIIK